MSKRAHSNSASGPDNDGIESRDAGLIAALGRVAQILLKQELARWRPLMVFALVLTIFSKIIAVSAPLYFGDAVNALTDGQNAIGPAMVGLSLWVLARFTSVGLPYLRDGLFAPVSQDAQRVISVGAFRKAQDLSLRFHLTRRTGALNRVIERGAGALDFLIRFLAFNIAPTFFELFLAAIVLSFAFGIELAIVAIITVIAYVGFTLIITEWRVKQRRLMNEKDTQLKAGIVDSLTNFETVKSFAAEARESERYDQFFRDYSETYIAQSRSLSILNAGQELIMNIGLFAIATLAVMGVVRGEYSAGDIAAVTLILMNLYRPLNLLGWAWREIKQGAVDLEKLFGLMEQEPEVKDASDAVPAPSGRGEVRFENVSFAHDGRAHGLTNVSFTALPGKKLALVGPSGSGKSTLLRLIFRFYDADSGTVYFNDIDVKKLIQTSLRDQLSLVPQDVVLFNTTLRENVLYGRPDATLEELDNAAEQAQLSAFIASLPEGWETRVGERGLKLSGGEKQRVGIARAILKDPSILLLDEATSALDSTTEAEVQKALEIASRGRTTIVVAHRLSTIIDADLILVLKGGAIEEQGDHQQLIQQAGLYANMWAQQSKSKQNVDASNFMETANKETPEPS